jgi:hypothetical protein
MRDSDLTQQILGAAIEVHRLLGPGLLESAYEAWLGPRVVAPMFFFSVTLCVLCGKFPRSRARKKRVRELSTV